MMKIKSSIVFSMALAAFTFAEERLPAEECFKIGSAEELYAFSRYVNGWDSTEAHPTACGELVADITLNEDVIVDDTLNVNKASSFIEWKQIGVRNHPFSGTFKGHGHKIKGLFSTSIFPGFFGYVAGGTLEKPITIDSLYVEDSYLKTDLSCIPAGFVSYSTDAFISISNVSFSGLVISQSGSAGGLIGTAVATVADISSSANKARIIAKEEGGGFVGNFITGNLFIKKSYNRGPIYGDYAGGFVGKGGDKISFLNSYNNAYIKSISYAGGFVGIGLFNEMEFLNSYNVGTVYSEYLAGGFTAYRVSGDLTLRNVFNFGNVFSDINVADDIINECSDITALNVFYNGYSCVENAIRKDSSDFFSGVVAARLRDYSDEKVNGSIWGQAADDNYPKLSNGVGIISLRKISMFRRAFSDKNAIEQVVTMPRLSVRVAGRCLQIAGAKVGGALTVFDMRGKEVFTTRVDAVDFSVDMPQAGTYLVRVDSQIRRVNVR
ncbi:MAG: hypothetical protein MJY82_10720 [Fibrobacter sp.]|nr:hypothetical protein [Fibrobacter sp.]